MTLEVKTAGTTALLAAAAAASAGSASAADLYTKAQPSYVPAPSSWQGFYVGGGVGASWLNSEQDDTAANFFGVGYGGNGTKQTANAIGFVGTLQAGYNFQDRNFVYGLEGDISWISGKASSSGQLVGYNGYTTAKSTKVDALATFRARFGLDFGGTMPYLTAGVALGDIKNSYSVAIPAVGTFNASKSSWQPGLVVGGGVEHKFTNSPWSIKGEVLWVGFKDTNVAGGPGGYVGYGGNNGAPGSVKFSNSLTLGKIGLNYRF